MVTLSTCGKAGGRRRERKERRWRRRGCALPQLLGLADGVAWSQWLWGSRASLLIAVVVTLLSTGLSWMIGLSAALWHSGEAALTGAD